MSKSSPYSKYLSSDDRRDFAIQNATKHDEIILTKTEWDNICHKISEIDIKNRLNIPNILSGAIITSGGATIIEFFTIDTYINIWPLFLWLILYVSHNVLCSHCDWKWLHGNKEPQNSVHLEDIKKWINEINKRDNNQS